MQDNNINNSKLNDSREAVNKNVDRYLNVGKSKSIAWNKKRTFRSI